MIPQTYIVLFGYSTTLYKKITKIRNVVNEFLMVNGSEFKRAGAAEIGFYF